MTELLIPILIFGFFFLTVNSFESSLMLSQEISQFSNTELQLLNVLEAVRNLLLRALDTNSKKLPLQQLC